MNTIPCTECPGEVLVGQFSTIRVMLTDDDSVPLLDDRQEIMFTSLKLPLHRARFVGNAADRAIINGPDGKPMERNAWGRDEDAPHSVFDPTGLAPAPCAHGLAAHPNRLILRYGCSSWVRAKYLDVQKGGVTCPICRGEEQPADMLVPRVAQ